MGLIRRFFGNALFWPRLAQIILSTASLAFLWQIARLTLRSRQLALVAVAGVAFYPSLVGMSTWLWAESNYVFFSLGAIAFWLTGVRTRQLGHFVAAGAFFAVAALLKSIGVFTIVPWLAWYLLRGEAQSRGGMKRLLAFVATVALCIAPWTYRNYLVFDRFVLVDMSLGRNLYYGHNAQGPVSWDYGVDRPFGRHQGGNRTRCDEIVGNEHPKDVETCEIRGAATFVLDHRLLTARRCVVKIADLLAPTSPVVKVLAADSYRNPPSATTKYAIWLVTIGAWMVAALGASFCLTLMPATPYSGFYLGMCGYYFAIHAVTVGQSRYRNTLEPLLVMLAVAGWADARRAISQASPGRIVLCLLVVATLLWMWSRRMHSGLAEAIRYFGA